MPTNLNKPSENSPNFLAKLSYMPFLLAFLYLLWTVLVVGFRTDHLVAIILCLGAYYAHPTSRKFLFAIGAYLIYGAFYDSIRVLPNHALQSPNIVQPYVIEKLLFGFVSNGEKVIPCEYWSRHTTTFLDIWTGLAYLNWLTTPILIAIYLWLKDKRESLNFSYIFVTINLIGICVYYLYPAAPPWYVAEYGFDFNPAAVGNEAGLKAFDAFFGIDLFHNMYTRNPNVYAAIPSLHSAYPAFVLFYAIKNKFAWQWTSLFGIHALSVWFGAVYLGHHYIIDVILGIICALLGYYLFEKVILKTRFDGWLRILAKKV